MLLPSEIAHFNVHHRPSASSSNRALLNPGTKDDSESEVAQQRKVRGLVFVGTFLMGKTSVYTRLREGGMRIHSVTGLTGGGGRDRYMG